MLRTWQASAGGAYIANVTMTTVVVVMLEPSAYDVRLYLLSWNIYFLDFEQTTVLTAHLHVDKVAKIQSSPMSDFWMFTQESRHDGLG